MGNKNENSVNARKNTAQTRIQSKTKISMLGEKKTNNDRQRQRKYIGTLTNTDEANNKTNHFLPIL